MGELVTELGRDLPYRGATEFNCLARHLMVGRGDPAEAHASAEADSTTPRRVIECLKSAVVGGSLTDPTWAGALGNPFRQVVAAYIESLSTISFFDFAWTNNSFVRVEEAGQRVVITTQSATGATVAESAPVPLSSMTFAAPSVALRKTITDSTTTNEVVRNPANSRHIGRELQADVGKAVDVTALGVIIAAGTSTATAGPSVANLISDIQSMFADIEIGQQSRLYFILNPALAASLSARLAGSVGWTMTPRGGQLAGVDVVVSAGAPAGNLILVDASRFAAFNNTITLAASDKALVQLNSSPDSPPTSSTAMISLWQHNMVQLRAVRYWGFVNLTTTCASTTTGMT